VCQGISNRGRGGFEPLAFQAIYQKYPQSSPLADFGTQAHLRCMAIERFEGCKQPLIELLSRGNKRLQRVVDYVSK
jgi:hypothetical protein